MTIELIYFAQFAVELEVLNFLEDGLEGGPRRKPHRDQVSAADQTRRTQLFGRMRLHLTAAEMVKAEVGIRGQGVHARQREQFLETVMGKHPFKSGRPHFKRVRHL